MGDLFVQEKVYRWVRPPSTNLAGWDGFACGASNRLPAGVNDQLEKPMAVSLAVATAQCSAPEVCGDTDRLDAAHLG